MGRDGIDFLPGPVEMDIIFVLVQVSSLYPSTERETFPHGAEVLDTENFLLAATVFSERELTFTFAIMLSPDRLSSVVCRLSDCLSVTLVHPTQAVQIFGNISMALGT